MTADGAAGARGERDEDEEGDRPEGAGRSGRSDFDREVYPRAYPVPGRLNLKRAMRAYVHGHDRGWEAERKAELAAGGGGEEGGEDGGQDGGGFVGAGAALDRGERTDRPGAESGGPSGPEEAGEGRRYGIPVPETLDFHRGADTWRDRIPRPERSRRPAGWTADDSAEASGEDSGTGSARGDDRRGE